jgi:uncharacterized protein
MESPTVPVGSKDFDILLKPTGGVCNLHCRYCYYLEKQGLYPAGRERMSGALLEKVVREYLGACKGPRIPFTFHGGEPTLLGIPYFRHVLELQKRYGDGRPIDNAIQTNGTLLNDEWGDFLREESFLVGLSLDGPEELHDAFRTYRSGRPSFKEVMHGLDVLRRHKVEYNTLSCVHSLTSHHAARIYKFLRGEGVRHMQFIPIVERAAKGEVLAGPPSETPEADAPEVTAWSVDPHDYGDFLCRLFDEWRKKDVGRIHVQLFETALAHWLGMEGGLCFFRRECGCAPVVEHNGDVYACDHYVYPGYRVGNLTTGGLATLAESAFMQRFGARKRSSLTRKCRDCDYLFACNGECPKHRFTFSKDGEYGQNYLCPAYLRFFRHIAPTMDALREDILARGLKR